MAQLPSQNFYYGTDTNGTGGYWPSSVVSIQMSGVPILTAGSAVDIATGTVNVPRYLISSIYAETISSAATLAAGTIDIRTAAAGGGSSILTAPAALTSLTAINLIQSIAPAALGSVLTASSLIVRQTVNSLNTGSVGIIINIIPLP